MSRAMLNMPTNSSSADGSRVVLVSGARVPPMRSDGDGCAAGLTSSSPTLCHAVTRAPPDSSRAAEKACRSHSRCANSPRPDVDTVNGRSVIIPKLLLNMINAAAAFALRVSTCAWLSLSLPH